MAPSIPAEVTSDFRSSRSVPVLVVPTAAEADTPVNQLGMT
jgi:hypothetical protein